MNSSLESVRSGFSSLRARNFFWLIPLGSTLVLYAIIAWVSTRFLFASWLKASAVPLDIATQVVIGYAFFCISRRIWPFLIVQGLFMAFLYIGNAVMIRFFEAPITPADVNSLRALVEVLPFWRMVLLIVPFVALGALFLWNLNLRPGRLAIFVGLLGVPAGVVWAFPAGYVHFVDSYRNHRYYAWDQLLTYRERGPVLYFTEAGIRSAMASSPPPTQAEVAALVQNTSAHLSHAHKAGTSTPAHKRDVYIVLVESFWNPAALTAAGLSANPWPAGLEKLWEETGYSRALSPVFGHLTANAEYEVLCGEPALTDSPYFVTRIHRPLPCLPRYLAQRGYITIAQHPNEMNFWARVTAYRRLGFKRYYSKKDFTLNELDGSYLSDSALLDQAEGHVEKLAGKKPVLSYIMTLAGHYPYKLNSAVHPDVISIRHGNALVRAEVNSIHYTATALLHYIQSLRKSDPTGIIVIAGDHLPIYGASLSLYTHSGLFPKDVADSTPAQFKNHFGTPLIVINGRKGPVKLGAIPMYDLAQHIVRMLGNPAPTVFNLFDAPDGIRVRPHEDLSLVLDQDGSEAVCHEGITSRLCRIAAQWNQRARTLSADLLEGGQFSLARIMGPDYSLQEPATDFAYIPSTEAAPCHVDVINWGPKWTDEGRRIRQPSGTSAFWVRIKGASADVKLRFDGRALQTARRTGLITGTVGDFDEFDDPGEYPLDAVCRYSPSVVHIGTFVVRDR